MVESGNSPMISLTVMQGQEGLPPGAVRVKAGQLIAYESQQGFTRLRMLGAKWLDVKEGTDEIDRLIRAAASSKRGCFEASSVQPFASEHPLPATSLDTAWRSTCKSKGLLITKSTPTSWAPNCSDSA